MALHALFIGIDRFASPHINWLCCARRDAVALHALFTDTFGAGGVLPDDKKATRAAIEAWFRGLAGCSPDDVVVISFSGHGSTTHELMTYDADPRDLPNTAIPLATLTGWFSAIPAERLLCVLDCCFSGEMGARSSSPRRRRALLIRPKACWIRCRGAGGWCSRPRPRPSGHGKTTATGTACSPTT